MDQSISASLNYRKAGRKNNRVKQRVVVKTEKKLLLQQLCFCIGNKKVKSDLAAKVLFDIEAKKAYTIL